MTQSTLKSKTMDNNISQFAISQFYISSFVRHCYLAKEQSHGFTAWSTTTVHDNAIILSPGSALNTEGTQRWCNAPDMLKGQTCKTTSPV